MKFFLILLLIALVVIGPIFTLVSLNILFGLAIPLTFGTWLAALWLGMLVYGATSTKK